MAEAGPWIFNYDVGRTYADQTLVPPTHDDYKENVVALQRKHMSPWFVALSPDQTKLAILQVAYVLIIERNGSLADASTTAIPLPVTGPPVLFARELCWAHDSDNLLFTAESGQCFVYSLSYDVWAEITHPLLTAGMPITGLFPLSTQGTQLVFALLRHSPAQLFIIKARWSHPSMLEVADVTEHSLHEFFVSTEAGCVSADRQTLLVVGQKTNTDMDYAVLVLYKFRSGFAGIEPLHEVSLRRGGATEIKTNTRSWTAFFTGHSASVRLPKPVSKVRMVQLENNSATLIALLDADGHVSIAIAGDRGFTIHAERQTLEYLNGGPRPTTSIELSSHGPTLIAVSADGEVVPFTILRDGTATAADVVETPPKFGSNVSTVATETAGDASPSVYLVCGPPVQYGCQVQPIQMQAVDRIQAVKTRAAEHLADLAEALNFARALSVAPDVVYKAAWKATTAKKNLVSEPQITKVLSVIHDSWWVAVECASCLGATATDTEMLFQLGLQRTSSIGRGDESMTMIRRVLLALQHAHTTFLKILQLVGRPYEAREFQAFVNTPLDTIATQFGAAGCVDCLAILFQRHAGCLARARLDILSSVPGYVHPMQYQYLLPAQAFPGPDPRSAFVSACMVAGKAQPLVDGKAFPVDEALQHVIQYAAVEEFVVEHALSLHPSFVESLYEFTPSDDEVSAESLVRWYSTRALLMESTTGHTAHAAYLGSLALERCTPPHSENRPILQEIQTQLFHLATLVYARLLPVETTFTMWLRLDPQEIIQSAIRIADVDDLPQVLETYVQPLFTGARRLYQMPPTEFLEACRELTSDDAAIAESFTSVACLEWPSDVEDLLVDSLLEKLRTDVRNKTEAAETLEKIAFVAEASKPTIPAEKRLLKHLKSLVRLVTEAITAYDQTSTGLALFWRLIECTPKVVDEVGLEQLAQRLDMVSQVLATCDIVSQYMDPPPVSLLLAVGDDGAAAVDEHSTHLPYVQQLWTRCKELALEVLRCARVLPSCQSLVETCESLNIKHLLILGVCSAVRTRTRPDWPLLLEHIANLYVDVPDLWWHVVVLKTLLLAHQYEQVPDFLRGGVDEHMATELLHLTAVDLINSSSSCADQTLSRAGECLELAPVSSPQVLSERAFLRALDMLNELHVDLVPLGVRTMSPVEVVAKVLQMSPEVYLDAPTTPGSGAPKAGSSQRAGGLGARLMRLARELGAESPNERAAVRFRIAQHAMDRADVEGCVSITDDLLDMLPTVTDERLVENVCRLVSKLCATRNLQSKELQALRVHALSVCPSECLAPLLRYSSPTEEGGAGVTASDVDARSPIQRIVADWQKELQMQEVQADTDKQLLGVIRKELGNLSDRSTESYHDELLLWLSRKEMISLLRAIGIGSQHRAAEIAQLSSSVQREHILYMLLDVEDSVKVRKLFALVSGFLVELQEQSVGDDKAFMKAGARKTFVEPDPALVAGIESMGFSRHGAERACSATNNESLEAALRWAIEHHADPDFDLPIAHRGQPLGYGAASATTGVQTAVADALRVVNRLASTYFSVSMMLSQMDDPVERHRILHQEIHSLQDSVPSRSRSVDDHELAAGAQQFSAERRRADACAAIGKFVSPINISKMGSDQEYTRSVLCRLAEVGEPDSYALALKHAELFGLDSLELFEHAFRFICAEKPLLQDLGRVASSEEPTNPFVAAVWADARRQGEGRVLRLLLDAVEQCDGRQLGRLEALLGLLISQTPAVDTERLKKFQEQLALLKRVKRALRAAPLTEELDFKVLIAWDSTPDDQSRLAAAVKEAAKIVALDNVSTIGKALSKLLDIDVSYLICARILKTVADASASSSELHSIEQLLGSEGIQLLQRLDDRLASNMWRFLFVPHARSSSNSLEHSKLQIETLFDMELTLPERLQLVSSEPTIPKLDSELASAMQSHLSAAAQLPAHHQRDFERTFEDAGLLDRFVAMLLADPDVDFSSTATALLPLLEDSTVEETVARLAPLGMEQVLHDSSDPAAVQERTRTALSRIEDFCGSEVAQRVAADTAAQSEAASHLSVEAKLAVAQVCAKYVPQEATAGGEGAVLVLETQLCVQQHNDCFVTGAPATITPSADDLASEQAMQQYVTRLLSSLATSVEKVSRPFYAVLRVLRLWKWSVHGSNENAQSNLVHRLLPVGTDFETTVDQVSATVVLSDQLGRNECLWATWDAVVEVVISARAWPVLIDILIVDLGRLTLDEHSPVRQAQQRIESRIAALRDNGQDVPEEVMLACGGPVAAVAAARLLDGAPGAPWFATEPTGESALVEDANHVCLLLLLQPVPLSKVARSPRYPAIVRCLLDRSRRTVEPEVLRIPSDIDVLHPLRPELHICRLVREQMPIQAAALLCQHCHIPHALRTPSGSLGLLRRWLARDTMITPHSHSFDALKEHALRVLAAMDAATA